VNFAVLPSSEKVLEAEKLKNKQQVPKLISIKKQP
jgi:hypothetical protein